MNDIPSDEPLMEPASAIEPAADLLPDQNVAVAYQPFIDAQQPAPEPARPMFAEVFAPEPPRVVRIPNFGHLLLVLPLLIVGFVLAVCVVLVAMHFHLFGVSNIEQMQTEIHYTLGAEGLGYLFTFAGCLIVFPLIWKRPYFAGLQWNGANVTPKINSSHAAPGSWMILSMGVFFGSGKTRLLRSARTKQPIAVPTSHQRSRTAVAAFHCSPAK